MKKTLKQFIFETMKEKGWVSDRELAKFCGDKEPSFSQAAIYQDEYSRLQNCKSQFEEYEDHPDTFIHKYKNNGKYFKTYFNLGNKTLLGENRFWKIPKNYYEYLKEKGIKEEER
jgi:hypothetical protein